MLPLSRVMYLLWWWKYVLMSRPQVRLDRIRLVRLPYTAAYRTGSGWLDCHTLQPI